MPWLMGVLKLVIFVVGKYVEKILGKKGRYRFILVVLAVVVGLLSWVATADRQLVMKPADKAQHLFGDAQALLQVPLHTGVGKKDTIRSALDRPDEGVRAISTTADIYLDASKERYRTMLEGDWPQIGEQFGYNLTTGRWPSKPGEIVASGDSGLTIGESVTAMDHNIKLRVVGLAGERFSPKANTLLAFPGTWNTIDPAAAQTHSAMINTTLFSTGITGKDALEEYVLRHVDKKTKEQLDSLEGVTLGESYLARSAVEDRPHQGFAENFSFILGVFALLMPSAVVLFLWTWSRKALAPVKSQLYTLGVNSTPLWKATVRKSFIGVILSAGVASMLGVGVAWLMAPFLADLAGIQGPGPQVAWKWLGLIFTGIAVCYIAGALWTYPYPKNRAAVEGARMQRGSSFIGSGIALWMTGLASVIVIGGTVLVGLRTGPDVFDVWAPIPVIAFSLFLALLVVRTISAKVPLKPRVFARRLAARHRVTTAIAIFLLTASSGMLIFSGTFSKSFNTAANKDVLDVIRSDQVGVEQSNDLGQKTTQKKVIELAHDLGIAEPVRLLTGSGSLDWVEGMEGAFGVSAVDGAEELERLIGRTLDAKERAVLQSGGMLVRHPGFLQGSQALLITEVFPDGHTLPATVSDFGEILELEAGAILLTETLEKYKSPLGATRWVFTELSEPQKKALIEKAVEQRVPRELLLIPRMQEQEMPEIVYYSLATALIGSCLIVVMVSRANAKSLEAIRSTFWTLGLPDSWHRWVLRWSMSIIVVRAFVLGVIAGLGPAALVAATQSSALIFTIDWVTIVFAAAALIIGTVAGLLIVGLSRNRGGAHS